MRSVFLYKGILALSIGLFLSACAIIVESEPVVPERRNYRVAPKSMYTKSMIQEDSLQLVMDFQKNKEVMLLHQIKELNGCFYLDLTEADIRELNIPDSLCDKVNELIRIANDDKNK